METRNAKRETRTSKLETRKPLRLLASRFSVLLFGFWLLTSVPPSLFGTITLVHHGVHEAGEDSGATIAAVTLSSVTSGNYLVVAAGWCDATGCGSTGSQTISVADTFSSSFTACPSPFPYNNPSNNYYYLHCWYGPAGGSGSDTITLTASATVYRFVNFSSEYSGIASFDSATPNAASANTGASTSVTTAGSTAVANELIFSWVYSGATGVAPTAGANYTLIDTEVSDPAVGDEYQIGAAIQSYTATFTISSWSWASGIITFKPATGGISPSGTAAVCTAFNASSGAITRNEAAGNTVVVVAAIRTTTSTVSSISGGGTYYQRAAINNSTSERVEIWSTNVGASTSASSVTINLGASSKFVGCVFEYSGVQALGNTNTGTSGSANPSISVTTQDSNNYCVGGFSGQNTGTFTSGTGTLRASAVTSGSSGSSNVGGALVDNTIASPGSCTTSVTNADTSWALAAQELRSVAPTAAHQLLTLGVGD